MLSYCCDAEVTELEIEDDNKKLYMCLACQECFGLSGCYDEAYPEDEAE